ncbi:hypothetical protein STCU_11404 [Strigomonas culicis]|uniref:Uncharacterized protein n=1 Tax=Strigomonas culicis TaxID=28005 RepID=S9TIX3_9TRYP|nr:hypothetical protein STCU_11404 [Strigomonas culicis]|eukprot:EPY16328.1 hypothetical protein STCU_11404 [Strigomonas culicis]
MAPLDRPTTVSGSVGWKDTAATWLRASSRCCAAAPQTGGAQCGGRAAGDRAPASLLLLVLLPPLLGGEAWSLGEGIAEATYLIQYG